MRTYHASPKQDGRRGIGIMLSSSAIGAISLQLGTGQDMQRDIAAVSRVKESMVSWDLLCRLLRGN